MGLVFFFDHHPFVELRDKLRDRIVQADFAFVHQHHDGRAGEHFGHRSDPEHVVFADRLLRLDIGIAEQIFVVNLAVLVGDDADDARQFVAVQVRLHGRRHFGTGRRVAFSGVNVIPRGRVILEGMNWFFRSRPTRFGGQSGLAVCALSFCLLGCGFFARAQVDHFEISPIASPQHVSGFFPSLAPFSVTVTARGAGGNIVPFNGEAALTGVLNGTPDYTYNFEEGNLNLWTRLNPFSSYAVTSLDVDGDGHDSLALDMRLNYGTGYGISRQVFLQGGVAYTMAIASAFKSDQDVFYGGPYVRWSLRVETTTVAEYQLGLGYMFSNLTQRVGLSGAYVPPTNGLYTIAFVFECPFAETRMHVYADNFRVGYASLGPASVVLANGQGSIGITADRPVTNIVLRATDAQLHTGDSNPFDILPMANLNLYTFVTGAARVGEDIIYRDVVYNFGPSTATDVRVTNTPPAGLTIVSAVPSQGACTNIGGILYCNLGAIPGNTSYQELVITARTATPGLYTNFATAGANEYDPDSAYTTSERVGVISVDQPFVEAPAVSASEGAGVVRFGLEPARAEHRAARGQLQHLQSHRPGRRRLHRAYRPESGPVR